MPVTLAIVPVVMGVPDSQLLFNVAFAVVLLSLLVQGATVPLAARWLGVEVPPRDEPRDKREVWVREAAAVYMLEFCVEAGGPCEYSGDSMEESHKGLNIDRGDFNALVEDLIDAMDAEGVAVPVQNRLLARLAAMRGQIIGR